MSVDHEGQWPQLLQPSACRPEDYVDDNYSQPYRNAPEEGIHAPFRYID